MKEIMKRVGRLMVYFFTPEDSTAETCRGDSLSGTLNLGSIKALFWVLGTIGIFYLMTLI